MKVGADERLLPTTMVGNYPNPRWYDGSSFARYPGTIGTPPDDPLAGEALADAILAIAHDQEVAGLDVIADGRVYGGDSAYGQILYHYVDRLDGFLPYGPDVSVGRNHLYAPSCVGPVSRRASFHLDGLKALRGATAKPVKVSYTGIQVLALFTNDQYYRDHRKLALALADAFREDFLELADAGVDIIQLDEFVWASGVGDWEIEVLNRAVSGVDCQFWVHVCWGQSFRPRPLQHGSATGGFRRYVMTPYTSDETRGRAEVLWPSVMDADITALNYEVTNEIDLLPLQGGGWSGDFIAGIIDVRSLEVETPDTVADRIRQVLDVVEPHRVGLSTSCGLVQLPRTVAAAKLRSLAEGAAIVRKELGA